MRRVTIGRPPYGPYYMVGDTITIVDWRPWWRRLWDWIARRPPPHYRVISTTPTTFTVERLP